MGGCIITRRKQLSKIRRVDSQIFTSLDLPQEISVPEKFINKKEQRPIRIFVSITTRQPILKDPKVNPLYISHLKKTTSKV